MSSSFFVLLSSAGWLLLAGLFLVFAVLLLEPHGNFEQRVAFDVKGEGHLSV